MVRGGKISQQTAHHRILMLLAYMTILNFILGFVLAAVGYSIATIMTMVVSFVFFVALVYFVLYAKKW